MRSVEAAFRPTVGYVVSSASDLQASTASCVATTNHTADLFLRDAPARDDRDADQIPQRRRRQWRQHFRPGHRRRPYRRASIHGLQSHCRGVGKAVHDPQLETRDPSVCAPPSRHRARRSRTHLRRLLSISNDGRFVAFSSSASNLVAGDRNGVTDFFVHDRALGAANFSCIEAVGHRLAGASALVAGCRAMGATSNSTPTSPLARSIRARAAAPICMTGRRARKTVSASTAWAKAAIKPTVGFPTFPWMLALWRLSLGDQSGPWRYERTPRFVHPRSPRADNHTARQCLGNGSTGNGDSDRWQDVLGWAHGRLQFGRDRSHPRHRCGTNRPVPRCICCCARLSGGWPWTSTRLR